MSVVLMQSYFHAAVAESYQSVVVLDVDVKGDVGESDFWRDERCHLILDVNARVYDVIFGGGDVF